MGNLNRCNEYLGTSSVLIVLNYILFYTTRHPMPQKVVYACRTGNSHGVAMPSIKQLGFHMEETGNTLSFLPAQLAHTTPL